MSETFTALATRALADDFDLGLLTKARDFAREAVREIYRTTRLHRGDLPSSLTNIAGAATSITLTTASAAYLEAMIYADNGDEVRPIDFAELLQLRAQNPGPGRPEVFAVGPGTDATDEFLHLELWPAADRAYQVFITGAQEPALGLLDDGDVVPLPDAWTKLVYYYVRAELFALESDDTMFSFWQTRWITGCSGLRSDLQRTVHANRIIPGTWSNVPSSMPTFHRPGLF